MRPEPVTVAEQKQILEQDRQAIFADQPPIAKKLDIYEAMARALKYNVDYRTKLFEKQVALGQYDLSKYKFLPAFNVGSAINYRSNLPIADSLDTATNLRVPSFATASDRTIRTADVRMIWNLLDFGITYYQVKQEGNKALMADEARRKVVSQLLRDVRSAYWRAAIAQMMQPEIERILGEARDALDSSSEAQRKGLASPVKVLEYRKALLKLVDTLENLFNQMEMARTQLASLINEPLGQDFELDIPSELPMDVAHVPFCLPKMEELALLNKPEIREEIYRKRISVDETRKATLRMLPGLELSSGQNYSSNSYLHNKAWTAAGAQVTWNIFNVLSGPAAIKVSKANESVDDQRRMAVQMALLTKVHLAYRDYLHRSYQLNRASELNDLEAELTGYIRNAAERQAKSKLELIQAEVSALSARLNRDNSYAAVQEALGYVYDSMGVDPLDGSLSKTDLRDVSTHLALNLGTWTQSETAPFNWACYAPEREDQAYNQNNFRSPQKAEAEPVVSVASPTVEPVAAELEVVETAIEPEAEEVAAETAPVQAVEVLPEAEVQPARPEVVEEKPVRTLRKFETITFGASSDLSSSSAETLNMAADFMRSHPGLTLEVIGFSDNTGSLVAAHQASVARANAVARYLTEHGVDTSRVVSKGYGSSSPVATNTTPAGRDENKRVELYISTQAPAQQTSEAMAQNNTATTSKPDEEVRKAEEA
ncbi:MAG TPA: hypothetical protein DIW28_08160, partial [Zetaproteobacteria bacterium]|nr:hypothetical protein [Zetaproteobacteria bacterium]